MASGSQDLKDKTLGQLEALRTALTSTDWEVEMMSASPEQKQQNSDVRILADARIAQLEDVQLAQIQDEIDADAATLSDAIDGVQDALSDSRTSPRFSRRRARCSRSWAGFSPRPPCDHADERLPGRGTATASMRRHHFQPSWRNSYNGGPYCSVRPMSSRVSRSTRWG
jgi:hypothetical protein